MTAVLNRTETAGRSLIPTALFDRLSQRIADEHDMDRALAERIMDQVLAFLAACAVNITRPIGPSNMVDIGWHTFILYTRDYAEFCKSLAGRFIHHVPADDESGTDADPRAELEATVAAIGAAGYRVDDDLWVAGARDCSQCKDGCHDDPPPNPK